MEKRIAICPRCRKPAKDTRGLLAGFMRDISHSFKCDNCGYRGLPITMPIDEYKKMMKEKEE